MSASIPHSSHKIIRYKNLKNKAIGEKQEDAEILISSVTEEDGNSVDKETRLPFLKILHNPFSYFIIIVLFLLTTGILYYYCTDNLQRYFFEDKNNSSSNISCVPIQNVSKLIILNEQMTDYNTCSDNTTCHTLLDTIERKHDGLKYNFIIGPGGELYIGSGFNCLVNRTESALYVKLLKSEKQESSQQYLETRSRLSEIIDHGILCGKISSDYEILEKVKHDSGLETEEYTNEKSCSSLDCGKNRPYHVHDPGHVMGSLLHSEFGWTFCGNSSNTMSIKKGKVIRMESLPKSSCSPLSLVDTLLVDVVTAPTFSCSNVSTCLHTYEENHDGFKYNFIIGHNLELYVGLGFKCKAENTSGNIMKVKVLKTPDQLHENPTAFIKFLEILEEGIACGKVSENFSVKANCNITEDYIDKCRGTYEQLNIGWVSELTEIIGLFSDYKDDHYNISSEHGKGIVPSTFRYQFCHRKHEHEPSNFTEPTSQTNTTDNTIVDFHNTSCIPFKTVKKVILITEKTDNNSCSNNATCPSLLEIIENEHDGLMYNFVIGPRGELYIGSGFKCHINTDKSALYIKILEPEGLYSKEEYSAVCIRLSELIDHGLLCEKISKNYTTFIQFKREYNVRVTEVPSRKLCPTTGMNRSYHVHDPNHEMETIIPSNTGWTFCGNFSSSPDMKKDRVITMDSIPKQSCLPLDIIDEITVDVVETPEFNCSDDSSCLHIFEKDHDGFKYNFIIGHNSNVYVGLGFKCRAENSSSSMLKIKVLAAPDGMYIGSVFDPGHIKFVQIIDEGFSCGQISERFIVKAKCNVSHQNEYFDSCKGGFEVFHNSYVVHRWAEELSLRFVHNYYNISSEHGRGVVPYSFRYQFCSKNQSYETSTVESEPTTTSDYLSTHLPSVESSDDYDYSYIEDVIVD